ncbi:EPIDERMAL PATTERNING FACTOR-like protein [Trema orientale]|uniref:Epidermal patterning factor-like protein n=1 Tax=Trema orientale TaxID=63057 RepID=A0A2P5EU39_TREOI|nr:EPIDERMAL PATTERNING FACTOR-like protein [Trema orientale]
MASSSALIYLKRPNIAIILVFIFSLIIILYSSNADHIDGDKGLKQRKMVFGSKPPECVNKCLSCRPCMAALVISQHQKKVEAFPDHHQPESYYLLAWKCKCRDKFFQP